MNNENIAIISLLKSSVSDDNFQIIAYNLLKDKHSRNDVKEIFPQLFELMEEYSEQYEFGMPGPIVHFIESFGVGAYMDKLVDSIRKKPTPLTTWMLNRIINDPKEKDKKRNIEIMKSILINKNASKLTIEEANRFIEIHSK